MRDTLELVGASQPLRLSKPGSYHFTAGGELGFGISAAVGVQLAQSERPVMSVLGEGAAQYGIAALWTAVAYRVPVTFLVLRNDEYAILKWFASHERVSGIPGLGPSWSARRRCDRPRGGRPARQQDSEHDTGLTNPDVVPTWGANTPAAAAGLPATIRKGAAGVYLPACVNRIFGSPRGEAKHPSLPEALVAISRRAGLPVWIPDDVAGHCCGTPWSSKGFERGRADTADDPSR